MLALAVAAEPPAADTLWALLEAGASDVLWWPPTAGADVASQVLARLRRWQEVQQLMDSAAVRGCLVGDSAAWRALVRGVVEVAAFTQSPVLITGETGTGKDLIAQLIHRLSGCQGELTVLDCTTLSPELCGSELFGHEKGAFTGAAARDGAFALADGGVLFVDEVGELPLPLQAQLLRAVQERKYKRLGGNSWQPTQFRLVCATNRELEAEVAQGRFRADLYYRIAGWRCRPPPLRERPDDILPLVGHFLAQMAPAGAPGRDVGALDPAVRQYLLTRDYPGNVRELRQTVARIWHRHSGPGPITVGAVPPDERLGTGTGRRWPGAGFEAAVRHAIDLGVGLSAISQAAGDIAVRIVLEQEGGSNQRAALRLGVSDRTLQLRRKARQAGTEAEADGSE
ncbi:sigma 54-interacting transcriptional regulator [Rugamonas sp. CCM 8940]|uniref:sigma 54-interacting transcriptional regulator n=1 Tax=Rugamonas sp. CCM 8940 TaxID=2765359 RepID=UPI00351BEEC4